MSNFLKHYNLKIHVLSPIYIGNGQKIGKKEYIYLSWDNRVIIPDIEKMYTALQKKYMEREYLDYMLKNGKIELGQWLKQHGYQKNDYMKWKKYELDAGDCLMNPAKAQGATPKEIQCFIKDAYGMPYVPGSSLKGMIRTALLAYEVRHHASKYTCMKTQIQNSASVRQNADFCLARETQDLESIAFHTLQKDEKSQGNAVNCNLSGMIVSDSAPISVERLILSQKIDYTLDGKEKPLPILREALAPGTDIYFEITIEDECPYTIEQILEALEEFQQISYQYFYSRFHRGTKEKNIVWLGGGVGYLSKTVIYPMFEKDAVRVVDNIFKSTLKKNYETHKHTKDIALRISPHICKCTRYRGELYDMGMGRIELLK